MNVVVTRSQIWIVGLAVVAGGAAALAASLVWLVLTRPIAAAEVMARLF